MLLFGAHYAELLMKVYIGLLVIFTGYLKGEN